MAIDITGFQRMRREQAKRQESPAWETLSFNELRAAAKEAGIQGYGKMNKEQLIEALKSR